MKTVDALASSLPLLLALAGTSLAAPGNVTVSGAVPPVTAPKGSAVRLTLADLDGDGRVEVIASFSNNGNIWRQLEGGQLTPLDKIPEIGGGSILAADLDGDGLVSLVSLNITGISAVESTGPFLFGPKQQLATDGPTTSTSLIGDLDGDGYPDVLGWQQDVMSTWLGDGAGGLLPSFVATTVLSKDTQLGDLDLDGQLDLVAALGNSAVPLLGNGDGTFAAQAAITLAGFANQVALGHVTGDASLDAAIATTTGVQLLVGDGTGGFSASSVTTDFAGTVALGDTDDDDDDDLIESDGTWVRIVLAEPGGLGASGKYLARAGSVHALALAHLDNDAPATVLALGGPAPHLDLTLADCGRDGLPALERQFAPGSQPLALADVDGDGHDELVVWQSGSGDIAVHEIPGDGTLGAAGPGNPIDELPAAFVLDLDGDSLQDLLLATGSPTLTWHPWRSNGNGTFTPGPTFAGGTQFTTAALGDLDGDGDVDLLIDGDTPEWHANQGDGSFGPALAASVPGLPAQQAIALGDADEDGLADLIAGSASLSGLGVRAWIGLGGGAFAPPVVLVATTVLTLGLRVDDVDGDGHVDVLIADAAPLGSGTLAQLTVIHGAGDGSFGPASFYPVEGIASGLPPQIVDFQGDGHRDVLIWDGLTSGAVVMPQAADGSFGASVQLAFALGAQSVEALVTDFDGDGVADLLGGEAFTSGEPMVRVSLVHVDDGALDLGHGTLGIGVVGIPVLNGGGSMIPGEKAFVHLQAAPANAPLLLILGSATAYSPVPIVAGVVVPAPQVVIAGLGSDAHGELELSGRWPVDAPAGFAVYAQVWTTEPALGLPLGSNALQFLGD